MFAPNSVALSLSFSPLDRDGRHLDLPHDPRRDDCADHRRNSLSGLEADEGVGVHHVHLLLLVLGAGCIEGIPFGLTVTCRPCFEFSRSRAALVWSKTLRGLEDNSRGQVSGSL